MTYVITFSDAKKNKYLKYGTQEMAVDRGLIVPVAAKITVITFNQQDADSADIEIKVNNLVVAALSIADEDHTFNVDIDVNVGDLLNAENTSNEDLKKATMTLFFDDVVPPPITGIQVGDIVNVSLEKGLLNHYQVLTIPDKEEVYWTVAPSADLTQITVVGPSMLAIVKIV